MDCSAEKFCPALLLQNITDLELEAPKGKPIETVRKIRDEIEAKVQRLIAEITWKSLAVDSRAFTLRLDGDLHSKSKKCWAYLDHSVNRV
jgi:hypothetical protein